MNATSTKGPGRPAGSKNIETVVQVITPACPECGSTERTKYEGITAQVVKGVLIDGRKYNRAIKKRTTCLNCDHQRIDEWIEIT